MIRSIALSIALAVALVTAPSAAATSADRPISIDMRGADIFDVVQVLAVQSGVNIVLHSSVRHDKISFRVVNRPFREVLQALCEQNDLTAVDATGGTIVIGKQEIMNRRGAASTSHLGVFTEWIALRNAIPDDGLVVTLKNALPVGTVVVGDKRANAVIITGPESTIMRARRILADIDRASIGTAGFVSRSLQLHYVNPKLVLDTIKGAFTVSPPASVLPSDQQNAVIVSGTSDFVDSVQRLVENLDRPGQQVVFEVRVADVTSLDDHSDVGAVFGGTNDAGKITAQSALTTFAKNAVAVNATLNFLISKGSGRILATPRIATLNNTRAELTIGTTYPVVFFDARTGNPQFQTVKAGVILSFTPTIAPDGTTTVDMDVSYSEITGFQSNYPVIGSRQAKDVLRVKDGETIVVAGLFRDIDAETLTKVPVLGDIPIVGNVFRDRKRDHTRDEIIFLITPHVVHDVPISS